VLTPGRPRHLEGCRELRRMVGIVVDDADLAALPLELKSAPDTGEVP
jgi:hypothetical protein